MNRRQLLIGIGGTTGLGSAIGTGAFTSVSAERDVTVKTADDADALLAMEPLDTPNGNEFATTEDGLLVLDFSTTNADGSGLGVDSIYDFDDVFQVTNQGTQPVYLWATFADATGSFEVGTPDTDIWLYTDDDSGNKLRDSADDVRYLTVGASADIGVHVDTDDLDEDQELTITITAAAEKPTDEAGVVGSGPTRIKGPTDGLANYWPLDAVANGNITDAAGISNPTADGGLSSASGVIGGAARFDGEDDVITTDLNPGASGESLTVAGWLKAPAQSVGNNHFVLSNYADRKYNGFFAIGTDNGEDLFFWARDDQKDNDKKFGRTDVAFDGNWHHYAGVRDASENELRFYVDGEVEGTASFPGDVSIRDSNSFFGMMQHYRNRNLEGDLDDVRLYGRALSTGEIASLYDLAE